MTKEVDQVVGGAVQQQAKSIGQEAVTAQAVGAETVLELLDAVLTLAAVVVESEDLGGTSGAVGNHEAQVGSGGRVLGLVADAALTRPTTGAMAEAGKTALRHLGAAIAAFQPFLPRFRTTLKDAVGGNAESILDLEELAELVQQGQSKTGVATQPDLHAGEGDLQQGIVAQTIGIIGVFVSGDDLIDALPQQRWRIVLHALFLTWVAEAFGPVPSQMMALIEGAQRQQTGVAGYLAAGKIGADGLGTVEGEGQLW